MSTKQSILKYFLLLLIVLISCQNESEENLVDSEMPCSVSDEIITDTTDYYNWEDIYNDSITTIVGQTIVIKSKVYWHTDFGSFDFTPEINPAGDIKLLFENADSFISNPNSHGQERGNLFLISDQIEKYVNNNDKQEKYALNCEELSNDDFYYLIQGRIEYRNEPNEDILNNPNFIIQSNNVVYWSQTFEFKSEIIQIIY